MFILIENIAIKTVNRISFNWFICKFSPEIKFSATVLRDYRFFVMNCW